MDKLLFEGYRKSLILTKKHARTFYFCSLFLEKKKRIAAYSVYAFSRMIDDSFDAPDGANKNKLAKWSKNILDVYGDSRLDDPVFIALRNTVKKYDIPVEYFQDLIKGMEMDLLKTEYDDFNELYKYCYRVAGVMGLIMARIFGYSDQRALVSAEKMGIAMQLTNILRDIKEDLAMGRLYLPLSDLADHNVSRESLSAGIVDGPFKNLMKFEIERARSYYQESYAGLEFLPDKNSRFIARLMGVIYAGVLDSIEKNGYDVFSGRNFVPFGKKIFLLLKTLRSADESRAF